MATELVHRAAGLPDVGEAERTWKLAQKICTTDMVPTSFRGKPEQVLAAMLAGREVGLSPMEALRSFHVIEGKPSMSAELMMTLALRSGHDLWVSEASRERAVVTARHRDWPEDRTVQVEFTIEDAGDAGLTGKGNWKKYARAMLRSRAVSEAVRQVCPEVLVGATYTAEELGAPVTGPTGVPDGHDPDAWVADADEDVLEPLDADVVDAEVVDDNSDDLPGVVDAAAQPDDDPDAPAADGQQDEETDPKAWRQIARDNGVTPTHVLAHLVKTWPSNNQSARPNNLAGVDALFAGSLDGADLVGDAIRAARESKEQA